jgi:hypothetical protein
MLGAQKNAPAKAGATVDRTRIVGFNLPGTIKESRVKKKLGINPVDRNRRFALMH